VEDAPLVVHRLGFGRVLAWFFVVVGVGVVLGGVVAGGAPLGLRVSSVAVGLALVGVSWLLGLRPRVEEEPDRVVVRNLLRDADVPWGAVTEVRLTDVVVLETAAGRVRCFALPRKGRPLLQVQSSATMQPTVPAPPPPSDPGPPPKSGGGQVAADRLQDLAVRLGPASPGEAAVTWSVPAVAVLAGVVGLLVVALVLR
jgi:hypothetical protein